MTCKILAMSLVLASNMGVAREGLPPNSGTLIEKWETPVLVLLSLALQVILAVLANQRKRTNNVVIRIIIWSAYMAADSVATFTLGVISTNLRFALKINGSLDASMELATFWAPFLLVHLGGQDTITAYALQDTELWLRHFSSLIVETGLALYIFFRVMKRSRLSTLSAMMLVAGVIKYGERTLCLWFASYDWRRSRAVKDYDWPTLLAQPKGDQGHPVQSEDNNVENELDEELATEMFQKTESMFADALLQDDQKSSSKMIVQSRPGIMVSKLIAMELELMYENLYTKAKVTHSWWGFALRLISFLLTLITLILFSSLYHRYNYTTFQLSVTYLLLVVAMPLEGYAAFVFLTSCRTISWLKKNGMHTLSRAMKCLSSLRTPSWSNSMGQWSAVKAIHGPKPMDRFRKVISTFHRTVLLIMRKPPMALFVYKRPVRDYVTEGIHGYLKQAETKYKGCQFSLVNSRGRVPLTTWMKQYGNDHHGGAEDDPTTLLNFDMDFGEVVIFWHIVTEVCYYVDYDSLKGEKGNKKPSEVYRDWKMSKYLSRYLMHLYAVSSDTLPPRGPLGKQKVVDELAEFLIPLLILRERINAGDEFLDLRGDSNLAAGDESEKQRRKRYIVQFSRHTWADVLEDDEGRENSIRFAMIGFIKALSINEDNPPEANASKQLKLNWKAFSEIWIELLASAANQCKGNSHAQHLRQGGELLTHVWVLLGHLGLIELW